MHVDERGLAEELEEHLRARALRALAQHEGHRIGVRGHEQIEHADVVADEHGLLRDARARVFRGDHDERVAQVLDVLRALFEERVAGERHGRARREARHGDERLRDGLALGDLVEGDVAEARVAQDERVRVEERRTLGDRELARAALPPPDEPRRVLEGLLEALRLVLRARIRSAPGGVGGRPAHRRHRAHHAAEDHRAPRQRDLARAAARAALRRALTLRVDELRLAHVARDDGSDRAGELDVRLREGRVGALHDDGPERAALAEDRHREERGVALLAEVAEVLVGRVRLRELRRDGPHVLDRAPRDALAHVEAHLADRPRAEAHVAAHDELLAVALDEVDRAHVRTEELREAPREIVEEAHERHRLRGEREELEQRVEARVALGVDVRRGVRSPGHRGRTRRSRGAVQPRSRRHARTRVVAPGPPGR